MNKLIIHKDGFDLWLVLPEKNNEQYSLQNRTEVLLGRKSKDINLMDLQLAPCHARLILENGKVYLENLEGSSYSRLQESDPLKLQSCNVKIGGNFMLHI